MVESHVAYNATKSLAILAFPCNQVVKFRYFYILMGLIAKLSLQLPLAE